MWCTYRLKRKIKVSIEFIFNGNPHPVSFSFPAQTADLTEEVAEDYPELAVGLRKFAEGLSEQLGAGGVRFHSISFTQIKPKEK